MSQFCRLVCILLLLLMNYSLHGAEKIDSPLLFAGEDTLWGRQLWQTDNTAEGTHVHTYLQTKPNAGSDPYPLGSLPTGVIFSAFSPTTGLGLWHTDGTPDGTIFLKNIGVGYSTKIAASDGAFKKTVATLGEKLVFWTISATSIDLSVTDGSPEGTQTLKAFPYKAKHEIFSKFYLVQQQAYFAVDNGDQGIEWWMTDGSVSGTQRVMSAEQLQAQSMSNFIREYVAGGDFVGDTTNVLTTEQAVYLLRPNNGSNKTSRRHNEKSLWKVTGKNAEKLYEFSEVNTPYQLLGIYDNQLFWQVHHEDMPSVELWRMKLGTKQPEKIYTLKTGNNQYRGEITTAYFFHEHLYFSFYIDGKSQMWASDLSTQGTQLLATFDTTALYPPVWFSFADRVYFFSVNNGYPNAVWITDGTKKGTRRLMVAENEQCSSYPAWGDAAKFHPIVGSSLVFATYLPQMEPDSCLIQLWSLSPQAPETPQLLGTFAEPNMLPSAPNSPLQSLQFISNQYRWQTDGTKLGTKNIGLDPVHFDRYERSIVTLPNPRGGWILSNNDEAMTGAEIWWFAPDPKASSLLKDINTAPASVESLHSVRLVGTDWYYGFDDQLWFIKTQANSFTQPTVVAGLPNSAYQSSYYAFRPVQDAEALYLSTSDAKGKNALLWQIKQGIALNRPNQDQSLTGTKLRFRQTDNFQLADWEESNKKAAKKSLQTEKGYSEFVYETSKGWLYDGVLQKEVKKGAYKSTDYLWWQAKGSAERQLIYKNSTDNFVILRILETEHDLYALRMDENIDTNDLVRIDLQKKRLVPIKGFNSDYSSTPIIYEAQASNKGLFITSGTSAQTVSKLWFLADQTHQLKLLKPASANDLVSIDTIKVWKDICYFNLYYPQDSLKLPELWMSQGTPETTHLIKQGVRLSYF